jgi:hypothetical protein
MQIILILSAFMLIVFILSVLMPSVLMQYPYAECCNAECCNAECHGVECCYDECHCVACHGAIKEWHDILLNLSIPFTLQAHKLLRDNLKGLPVLHIPTNVRLGWKLLTVKNQGVLTEGEGSVRLTSLY